MSLVSPPHFKGPYNTFKSLCQAMYTTKFFRAICYTLFNTRHVLQILPSYCHIVLYLLYCHAIIAVLARYNFRTGTALLGLDWACACLGRRTSRADRWGQARWGSGSGYGNLQDTREALTMDTKHGLKVLKGAQAWDIRSLGFSWFLHHKASTCGRLRVKIKKNFKNI